MFGEWYRAELDEAIHFEDEVEWLERVRKPAARLQSRRLPESRHEVLVPWMEGERRAWILPGRYIYITRGLLERLPDEDSVAFIIGHELAHHELGHLNFFEGWLKHLDDVPLGPAIALLLHGLINRAYSPEQELEADRLGFEMCLKAGYDGRRCIEAFHILKLIVLDLGAIDVVFGPDLLGKSLETQWFHGAKLWLWQRGLGYLPIEERRKRLEAQLEEWERRR